ncbi:IS1 family transposase [Chloroflexota bacterium]
MNKLSLDRRVQIIKALCEGKSIRSTARITDSAVNTVVKLLKDVGIACIEYQDKHLKNIPSNRIQCDEIWSFCYAKQKNVPADKKGQFGYGDVYTWVAIDADTKLVIAWLVGLRDADYATEFMKYIQGRLANKVQLTTDAHGAYLYAVDEVFGSEIDFAQLVKIYGQPELTKKDSRYSPAKCNGTKIQKIQGKPDPKHISTSYVERQNLTMRMCMRRFTRLTNGFSKKIENHTLAIALHFMYYNFARPHKTLTKPYETTPAMAAGISDHIWTMEEIIRLTI